MAILNFQKPDKIVLQKANDFEAQFEFRPLEPGYGVTIGNALRRVLLSSLEGYAITAIKIAGADHEFATIKGVLEDVTEIILNLKQVRLKKAVEGDVSGERIELNIKGQETFTAAMIGEALPNFQVMNPELIICNMEPGTTFNIELHIGKGRGYVPAEENRPKEAPLGIIAIDSIYTPIKNVKYSIENTRVEQRTDFEKLIMDVSTDGTIHPEEAVKEASRILIQHLMIITDENISLDTKREEKEAVVDEETLQLRKVLNTPLEDLELSVRAFNCLKAAKINSLSELVQYTQEELMKFRNFGQKSLSEIEQVLGERGLHFGMDISKFHRSNDN
ncbi:MAG: DNA-directed polymerase subunit alpha [Flavipsychrobacter sp.]|jgi:DNA-directed RNA polymerase subunit alpha|nr:DNA-directed polymerase subunit alpha [Flavipsychrobacter sp.]